MQRIVHVLCAFALVGCQQTLLAPTSALPLVTEHTGDERVLTPTELGQLKRGSECTVTLSESTLDTTYEVTGTVASAANGVIVLSDATEVTTGRSEAGAPVISNVPYVKRLFKNTGVGTIRRPVGTKTLSSKQIKSVLVTEEAL